MNVNFNIFTALLPTLSQNPPGEWVFLPRQPLGMNIPFILLLLSLPVMYEPWDDVTGAKIWPGNK